LAAEYFGNRHDSSLVSPYVVGFNSGPEFPVLEFKKLGLPDTVSERYDSAHYRLVWSRSEIYITVYVELIGTFEDLVIEVMDVYELPLERSVDFDRGMFELVEWKSHDSFVAKLSAFPDYEKIVTISIGESGKFEISSNKTYNTYEPPARQ
ncbi:MAG: hypothetical protein GY820_17945, partial [Gammaproteobacteria bacterium]|nr:hypothetical protein [Gammaproteobacteria bacterium]